LGGPLIEEERRGGQKKSKNSVGQKNIQPGKNQEIILEDQMPTRKKRRVILKKERQGASRGQEEKMECDNR